MFKRSKADKGFQSSVMAQGNIQRLVGLDLFRGIAAFAVVILHSDEGLTTLPASWAAILNFSGFAVPFFLATSFYLTIGKLSSSKPMNWRARLPRLLIPYAFWSLIYLGINLIRFVSKHESAKIEGLWQNSLGIIFLGQAGFHLYFIPLLVTGMLIVMAAEPLLRQRIRLPILLGFLTVSLLAYATYGQVVSVVPEQAGIDAVTGTLDPEQRIIFVLLKIVGYGIRCLPYIAIALFLHHASLRRYLTKFDLKTTLLLLIACLGINLFAFLLLPAVIHEMLRAYSVLLLALALSNYLKPQAAIASVSNCSFGIYLMHLLIVQLLVSVAQRIGLISEPVSLVALLSVVIAGFGLSWLLTLILMRSKMVSRLLFGT